MSTRGKTIKQESSQALILLRPMITRRYEFVANHETCCGCGTCATLCPQEAITLSELVVAGGRLVSKPRIDVDPAKCNFCGECVVLCPTRSLTIKVNGEPETPVVKAEAFPLLIRKASLNQEVLKKSKDLTYVANCPSGALSAEAERDEDGNIIAVRSVALNREVCFSCTRCMNEGPRGGIAITKPYLGRTFLDTALCPEGCQVCADICPTRAITYDGRQVALDERFCLYCGACERVCPVEGALRIVRTGFLHTPIESGAWRDALEKLVSTRAVAREFDIKGQQRRRAAVLKRLLPEMEPNAGGNGHR